MNTYFDQGTYENEIDLETNADVLERIYNDGVEPKDELPIEFFFLTDTEIKAINFKEHLQHAFPTYQDIEISDYDGDFEISGITTPVKMELQAINNWNSLMWDTGYKFDCRLDGWQVGT
ncbi:ribonuclease E inhibitor RraB [Mucilaginibacter sp. 3215]|uniref:ribonuclease E inhibitor RraB n=1 Tax=Mucilaginibacter sp. 3215 TaxID=3373912 RepID=UPI003D241BEC